MPSIHWLKRTETQKKNASFSAPFAHTPGVRAQHVKPHFPVKACCSLFPLRPHLWEAPAQFASTPPGNVCSLPQGEPHLVTATGLSRQDRGCRDGNSPSQGGRAALWPQSRWCPSSPQTCAALKSCRPGKATKQKTAISFSRAACPRAAPLKGRVWLEALGDWMTSKGLSGEQKLKLPQFETDQLEGTREVPESIPAQKGQREGERGCTRTSGSRKSSISSSFLRNWSKETFLFQKTWLGKKIISSWIISHGLFYFFNLNYANLCILLFT